ncbi:MAG: hypothetical protein AAFY60_09550 [Myxococcota bacterium]
MNSIARLIPVFAALAFTVGCGSSIALTTRGALVQLADGSALHPDCKPIQDVKVQGKDAEQAEIVLRNKAGAMAAQKVVIVNRAEVPGGLVVEGRAYGCPSGV